MRLIRHRTFRATSEKLDRYTFIMYFLSYKA